MVILVVLQDLGDAAGIRDTFLSSSFAVETGTGWCSGVGGAEVGDRSMEEDEGGATLHAR